MQRIILRCAALVLMIAASACTPTSSLTNGGQANVNASTTNTAIAADPSGTIVIEAGDGILSGAQESSTDYIKESARGLEAYLGSKGATATYTVTAPARGTYQLQVKLTDDGTWKNGDRDASVSVNGAAVLQYYHSSEDTRGWKWYTLGNASLKEGANTVAFTKANDMPAAFVMDEFKFIPVILQ